MKRFLISVAASRKSAAFLLLFAALCRDAATAEFNSVKIPNVTVTVSDFTLDYSPVSKEIALKPASGGTIRTGVSDADGTVSFARVTPGLYTLTIAAIGMDPLTLQVPNTTNTYQASALVISAWTPPSGARYAGASANLSELARRLAIVDGVLELDGSAVGGGGDTIWTNDTSSGSIGLRTTNNLPVLLANSVHDTNSVRLVYASWGSEIALASGPLAADWYVYLRDSGVYAPVFALNDESGYGGAVLFDSAADNGAVPFHFSSSVSNVVGSGTLARFQDGHVNAWVLTGTGNTTQAGTAIATNGFASTDTTAAVNIAATGWTNTLGKLTRVFFNGTAMTFTVKDSAGSPFYTNAVALTGSDMIILQDAEAITISGTGVAGVRKPL